MVARVEGNKVTGYDVFAEGWLEGGKQAWGVRSTCWSCPTARCWSRTTARTRSTESATNDNGGTSAGVLALYCIDAVNTEGAEDSWPCDDGPGKQLPEDRPGRHGRAEIACLWESARESASGLEDYAEGF